MKQAFKLWHLSSLNVALATAVCAAAFMKLPLGKTTLDWISLLQIFFSCWLVYILDRLLDVIRTDEVPNTPRHQFHFKHQYNLQVVGVALFCIVLFLLFFQKKEVIVYGTFLAAIVVFYLRFVVVKFPKLKNLSIVAVYVAVVVGVPFVSISSVNASSWVVAGMFVVVVLQNLFSIVFYEIRTGEAEPNTLLFTNENKARKTVLLLASINVFVFIILYSSLQTYVDALAGIFAVVSLASSYIVSKEGRFTDSYRVVLDSLLFLPALVLFF